MSSSVIVLVYHHIALPGNLDLAPTVIDAYPPDFEEQMRYVAAHYNVISSWDLVRALREGYTLPPRALIITFDDGYMCFQDTAFPVLERLNLPVTLFVPPIIPISRSPSSGGIPSIVRCPGPRAPRSRCRGWGSCR